MESKEVKYRMVRLRAKTHARLTALRDRLFAAYQAGKLGLPDGQAEHLTLDFVVGRLLRQHQDHVRRGAKSRKKR
jgi:hypothetical protein